MVICVFIFIVGQLCMALGSEREESADSMENETQKELVDDNETNVCMYLSEEKQKKTIFEN
jgi:preprotein translocase subunit SecG